MKLISVYLWVIFFHLPGMNCFAFLKWRLTDVMQRSQMDAMAFLAILPMDPVPHPEFQELVPDTVVLEADLMLSRKHCSVVIATIHPVLRPELLDFVPDMTTRLN